MRTPRLSRARVGVTPLPSQFGAHSLCVCYLRAEEARNQGGENHREGKRK